jgi:hypothetical protein
MIWHTRADKGRGEAACRERNWEGYFKCDWDEEGFRISFETNRDMGTGDVVY